MGMLDDLNFFLHITRSRGIVRRYFVVNGFDGALTMLGILFGFFVSEAKDLQLVLGACLGAAVALGMSGLSSAYISERAERKRELTALEEAMIADLSETAHGEAARQVPWLIAAVNGLAPLVLSAIILTPVVVAYLGVALPIAPLAAAILVALVLLFLMGVFLGQVGRTFWLLSGVQTVLIALVTMALIFALA